MLGKKESRYDIKHFSYWLHVTMFGHSLARPARIKFGDGSCSNSDLFFCDELLERFLFLSKKDSIKYWHFLNAFGTMLVC